MEVSLATLPQFANTFVAELPITPGERAHVVGLRGELGAGKTTFVQHVARELGVEDVVTSPTFVIAQRYRTQHPVFKTLVHMDAYRLEGEVNDTIGFSDYLDDPHTLVLVEWPEQLPREVPLPANAPTLTFTVIDETTRELSYA